jgi:hypothetical protein
MAYAMNLNTKYLVPKLHKNEKISLILEIWILALFANLDLEFYHFA